MKTFAALIERLETAHDDETAARALADWLAHERDPQRGVALGVLLGVTPQLRAGRNVLAALAERLDPELLAISREVSGDLTESVALMWPGVAEQNDNAPTLAHIAATLAQAPADRASLTLQLATWLDALAPAERVALLRLATGHVAGSLPARVAQEALALLGGVPTAEIEAVWHAVVPPYAPLFAWLEGRAERPSPAAVAPFRRLAGVSAESSDGLFSVDASSLAADAAWDGLRVLIVAHGETRRIYSRRGVDVADRFPELLDLLRGDAVLEGVVLARDAEGRSSRAALEARLGQRPRIRGEDAIVLMLHDLLERDGENLRGEPLRTRRAALESLAPTLPTGRAAISPLLPLPHWDALPRLRSDARALGAAGVILKAWDAPYAAGAAWVEVRCEPIRLPAMLLYIEYTADGIVATVGVWDGAALAPVAKVRLPDAATASQIAAYVGAHAVDRFGPVLQARADAEEGLVVEIAFDAIERAPRRKAGLLLRGARLVGVREGASPKDAAHLDDVKALFR